MEASHESLVFADTPVDNIPSYSEAGSPDASDNRPSILITFQNSASYYTSYMGSGGTRGAGTKRKNSDVVLTQQQHQQYKDHPIVIMNDYPNPGPVSVAVNGCKQNYDRLFHPYSGPSTPPKPQGPPGPPGPPMPNLPSSRRESMSTNTLELPPKNRRGSATPSIASKSKASARSRTGMPNNQSPARTHTQAQFEQFESSTLPRGRRARPPRNSMSMPSLADAQNLDTRLLQPAPTPSPRPSFCLSAVDSQTERRPLMSAHRSSGEAEDWSSVPQPKPNWLSLNVDEETRKDSPVHSVYVAEIWPSLVCILTAVLITLIVYILVSYFYYVPHPTTPNSLAPNNNHRPTAYPPHPTNYAYPYPYLPPPYDRYPPHQFPKPPEP